MTEVEEKREIDMQDFEMIDDDSGLYDEQFLEILDSKVFSKTLNFFWEISRRYDFWEPGSFTITSIFWYWSSQVQ